jgi:hypothetical protein
MTNVTEPCTGRSRGRPVGTARYALQDIQLLQDIRAQLVSSPPAECLRDAVRAIEPQINGFGTSLSRIRRVERRYRAMVST